MHSWKNVFSLFSFDERRSVMSSEKQIEKKNHTAARVAGGIIAAGISAYGAVSYYIFRQAFSAEGSSFHPYVSKEDPANRQRNQQWLDASRKTDEFINSYDGIRLHAMKIANHSESHKWMIAMHAYRGQAMDMLDQLYEADQRGFNVLAPDARGCGLSRGKYTGLGWPEHYDLISWIADLIDADPEAEIVLYGISMGASAVMNACGEYLSDHVRCAVSDSGYSSIKDELIYAVKNANDLPSAAFVPGMDFFCKHLLHFSIYDISTLRQLSNARVPVYFICSSADSLVPAGMSQKCYAACASDKEYKEYRDAAHGACHLSDGYYEDLFRFIGKYL